MQRQNLKENFNQKFGDFGQIEGTAHQNKSDGAGMGVGRGFGGGLGGGKVQKLGDLKKRDRERKLRDFGRLMGCCDFGDQWDDQEGSSSSSRESDSDN